MITDDPSELTALIVDDDPSCRAAAAFAFTDEGFQCTIAVDGESALKQCECFPFDVVLTDLRMPGMHGHSLAVHLLQQTNRPMIIVLTGVADRRLVRDLILRGVDDVFVKPADCDWIAAKTKALLGQRAHSPSEVENATTP